MTWLVLLERDYGVRQNYRREIPPSSIQASFLVEGKSKCLTDKLGRDFEMLVSNCREGKVPSDTHSREKWKSLNLT